MSEKNLDPKQSVTQRITTQMFKDYLKDIGFMDESFSCPICKSHDFNIPQLNDDNGVAKPVFVTTPIPTMPGKGVWNLSVSCGKCGYTLYFNAPFVTDRLLDAGKLS